MIKNKILKIAKFSKDVLKEKVFGFAQVDIEVLDRLYDKFSEMAPLFVAQEIPDIRKKLAEKQ